MHRFDTRSVRLAAAAALSVLVVGLVGSPASAHTEELAEPAPRGLIHLLTQWDHLAMIVGAVAVVAAVVVILRRGWNQAD